MTYSALFKNEVYLSTTSAISLGVLSGYAYFDLALAALLTLPFLKQSYSSLRCREGFHHINKDGCTSCK